MSLIICVNMGLVFAWDLHLSWWWKQDLWSLKQACCSCSLTLLLSRSLSQGIKVKTGIKWSVKHSRLSSLCLFLSFPSTFLSVFYLLGRPICLPHCICRRRPDKCQRGVRDRDGFWSQMSWWSTTVSHQGEITAAFRPLAQLLTDIHPDFLVKMPVLAWY